MNDVRASTPAGARTVRVDASRLTRWLDGFAERHGATLADTDGTCVRLTAADGARAWVTVPFPPLDGDAATLVEHSTRRRTVGVLLVRRSGHAAGVFDGPDLLASKVDSSYVQGTTKAGGWSQQRYARRRGNQAAAAFASAADVAVRVFAGHRLDALVAGGDRPAVRSVLDDPRLGDIAPLLAEPWLAVKDPKLKVLAAAPEQFLAVTIRLDP